MAAKKNSKAKKEDYDPNAPHEAGMKIDVKDGNDHQMSKDFTVERITAATMVTLACNTVAQALNTEEGTPSRNATVRMCNKTFGDMRKSAETCREAGDDFVAARKGQRDKGCFRRHGTSRRRDERPSPCVLRPFRSRVSDGSGRRRSLQS